MPSKPQSLSAMFLYSPPAFRRLCTVLRPASGIFASMSSRADKPQKQIRRKGHLQVRRAVLSSGSVSIYSRPLKRRTAAHRAPNRAQSNPGPLRQEQAGVLLFVAGQGENSATALVCVLPGAAGARTQAQISYGISPFARHPLISMGQILQLLAPGKVSDIVVS